LDACDVTWNVPGPGWDQSMPVGNGDIGLNVWVETNGDMVFYIGKTDAWNQDVNGDSGLMKVGGVRVSMNPSPLVSGAAFSQTLKLRTGEMQIQEGGTTLRVWVDANNPVIRVEATHAQPVSLTVSLNNWRPPSAKDVTLTGQTNRLAWYHRNPASGSVNSNVANLTFGAVIKGDGLVGENDTTLKSAAPAASQLVSIFPMTAKTASPEAWLAQLDEKIAVMDALNIRQTRQAHQAWWDQFWHRSWVFVDGDQDAGKVTQGYVLQRFITAAGGRGAYPIKFNGSIFIVDNPANHRNADSRAWGGQYWFQNTRAMYWPRLMAGDFDIMMPLFKMYAGQLPGNAAQVAGYYHHQGAYFAETAPFWGGLRYWGPEVKEDWTGHYFTPILEVSMMMLDYYEYTGDAKFARDILLPVATAGLTFFDQHFTRDADGKLLLDPDNSIEMFWKVHDPAPDIDGLHVILARMMALPDDLVSAATREAWQKMAGQLPELPTGTRSQKNVLLPYTGPQTNRSRNSENPELYAIYPFRLYGLGRPDLQLAVDTFNTRRERGMGCWVQDPIQAAMLGLTDVARKYTVFNLTRKEPALKFPAFWDHGHDYQPDEDNGGNGENGLQHMLMLNVGRKILLLPAWPAGWNAQFKLHALFQTTVQGAVQNGKLVNLVVDPPQRLADVVDMSTNKPPETSATASIPSMTDKGSGAGQPKSAAAQNPVQIENMLSAHDAIFPLKQTSKGKPNTLAVNGDFGGDGNDEQVPNAIDGNLDTKYFNKSRDDDAGSPGINTGFVVSPASGAAVVTGLQMATANDGPERDPLRITIEGSNDPRATGPQGKGFTLLYEGPTGLDNDPGRNQWGQAIGFKNATAYKTYRVLVTATRSEGDATQYSEVRLGTAVFPAK
jgi:hypothetical protein